MHFNTIASLISNATLRRKTDRGPAGAPDIPTGFAEFNDHLLRDIGFVRERTTRPRNYLMRL